MKIKCEVIRDLLPLYVDGVASEESRKLIEEHLQECEDCREYLKLLQEDLPKAVTPDYADEVSSLRKIKRRMLLNKVLIVMVTLGFVITAAIIINGVKLTEYEGSLEENISYEIPEGYEVYESTTDIGSIAANNQKIYMRETADTRETIVIYYNGLNSSDTAVEDETIRLDDTTEVQITHYDGRNDRSNELECVVFHDDEQYVVKYSCKMLDKENYYSSCSRQQQEDVMKFIKTFDYHRPDNADSGNIFVRLHHNLGTGGLIVLLLTILIFICVPIGAGIASLVGSSGSMKGFEESNSVISSKDLHESMNRERTSRGETALPTVNNVQGASTNTLARRDHSWSSVPDFFVKLFRRKK